MTNGHVRVRAGVGRLRSLVFHFCGVGSVQGRTDRQRWWSDSLNLRLNTAWEEVLFLTSFGPQGHVEVLIQTEGAIVE